MLDELTMEKDEEWLKTKKRYLKCDLLILDDWLLERISGKQARELLEIVEGRLRTGSLLICSQFSPAGWHAKLGEGAIADAVIDRKCEASHLRSTSAAAILSSPSTVPHLPNSMFVVMMALRFSWHFDMTWYMYSLG